MNQEQEWEKEFDEIQSKQKYTEYGDTDKRFCCGGDYCTNTHTHNEFIKSFIRQAIQTAREEAILTEHELALGEGYIKGRADIKREMVEKIEKMPLDYEVKYGDGKSIKFISKKHVEQIVEQLLSE